MQVSRQEFAGIRTTILPTVFYMILVILVSVASIAFAWFHAADEDVLRSGQFEFVTVQPGDTLWRLARDRSTPDADVRRTVYEIRKVNGLEDAQLHPGQQLLLPVVSGSV